eukprot:355334-Chlamydomonas_euryale.AAC.1
MARHDMLHDGPHSTLCVWLESGASAMLLPSFVWLGMRWRGSQQRRIRKRAALHTGGPVHAQPACLPPTCHRLSTADGATGGADTALLLASGAAPLLDGDASLQRARAAPYTPLYPPTLRINIKVPDAEPEDLAPCARGILEAFLKSNNMSMRAMHIRRWAAGASSRACPPPFPFGACMHPSTAPGAGSRGPSFPPLPPVPPPCMQACIHSHWRRLAEHPVATSTHHHRHDHHVHACMHPSIHASPPSGCPSIHACAHPAVHPHVHARLPAFPP